MKNQSTLKLNITFVREKIHSREIDLIHCNTNYNVVDIFTKPLVKGKFLIGRDKLRIVENSFLH
jgi:hypothetical protein